MSKLALTLLFGIVTIVASHSWMTAPRSYCRNYGLEDCKDGHCNLPCPLENCPGKNNSLEKPEAVYKRGQRIAVTWVLNNHHGGFYRLGFVPTHLMWSKEAHERFATHYGCWDANKFPCDGFYNCGTDRSKLSGGATITVPSCLPDGSYVVSYTWFGGLKTPLRKGGIPDYHHCSHVRISGGNPISGVCEAEFTPEQNGPVFAGQGSCHTSAEKVGDCKEKGCDGPNFDFHAPPAVFKNGRRPASFTAEDILQVRGDPDKPISSGPSPSSRSRETPTLTKPTPTSRAKATVIPSPSPGMFRKRRRTLCGGGVCCSPTCKQCAAAIDCHKSKTLNSDLCCRNAVLRTGRSCDTHEPPCVCKRERPRECPKFYRGTQTF